MQRNPQENWMNETVNQWRMAEFLHTQSTYRTVRIIP